MAEGIRKGPALLAYNDVRWLLDDHHAKRAGPLRWRVETHVVTTFGSDRGHNVEVKTLQELWRIGDEYEWRDVEEVSDG